MKPYYAFPFLAILIFALLGCGSEGEDDSSPSSNYFFKFKLDGVQMEYKVNDFSPAIFSYDADGLVYNGILLALGEGSSGTSDFVNVLVRSTAKFQTGIDYQLQDGVPYKGVNLASINFTYSDKGGQVYNAVLLQSSLPTLIVNDAATLRFTKITDTEVEGIFSGKLFGPVLTTGRGTVEKVVTDGQFKMKLHDNTN